MAAEWCLVNLIGSSWREIALCDDVSTLRSAYAHIPCHLLDSVNPTDTLDCCWDAHLLHGEELASYFAPGSILQCLLTRVLKGLRFICGFWRRWVRSVLQVGGGVMTRWPLLRPSLPSIRFASCSALSVLQAHGDVIRCTLFTIARRFPVPCYRRTFSDVLCVDGEECLSDTALWRL